VLGRAAVSLIGWRVEGTLPDIPKCVLIVAPHTSNFDLPIGVALMLGLDLRINWLGKHTIFWWPLGVLLRWLGGIAVDRRAATDVVAHVADLIQARPRIFLGLAPEGTRRRVERWKTGFYRIARRAGVPIVTVALDYAHRRVIIWPPFDPTGDLAADLVLLQSRFDRSMARHPDRFS
jgi:1-acyl-sn-glycerol-3-phosphate acyltransferase